MLKSHPSTEMVTSPKRVISPDPHLKRRLARLKRPLHVLAALVKALILVGCNLTSLPGFTPQPPTPILTATPSAAPGWGWAALGVETRTLIPPGLGPLSQVILYRFDPAHVTFKAHVAGVPLRSGEWRTALPNALGSVNANFFTPENIPIGLVVSDGGVIGASLVNRGGMFQVSNGVARVRSLIEEPYNGELLEQAVQGFPMLVVNRQPIYQEPRVDRTSRRTVVAQDSAGRILILITPLLGMTLNEAAAFLSADGELDIVYALNLDGGGSTLLVAPNGVELPSFDPVPVVLAFYTR